MFHPLLRAIANAQIVDRPLTAGKAHALGETRKWLKQNSPIPHAQVLTEPGSAREKIERYQEPA